MLAAERLSIPLHFLDDRAHYAIPHLNPSGPGDSRPAALDFVKDEGLQGKLSDKVVLITGYSSGIGIETARAFNNTRAKLFLGVRDIAKGQAALADILKPDGLSC